MDFTEIFENKKLSLIDFNLKKKQKYLITKIFEDNKENNLINIKSEYNKYTKLNFKLNSNEISQIKTKILGKYKSLSLLECIEKLKNKSQEIE